MSDESKRRVPRWPESRWVDRPQGVGSVPVDWRARALAAEDRLGEVASSACRQLEDRIAERDHARFMAAGWRRLAAKEADRASAEEYLCDAQLRETAAYARENARLRAALDTAADMLRRAGREIPEPRLREGFEADATALLREVGRG